MAMAMAMESAQDILSQILIYEGKVDFMCLILFYFSKVCNLMTLYIYSNIHMYIYVTITAKAIETVIS